MSKLKELQTELIQYAIDNPELVKKLNITRVPYESDEVFEVLTNIEIEFYERPI